jgi:hypothetical protein
MVRMPMWCAAQLLLLLVSSTVLSAADATVKIDPSVEAGTSQLRLGLTHTHAGLDAQGANEAAVKRATELLRGVSAFQNTHIMGWGVGSPMPKADSYNWASLDQRMKFMPTLGGESVITLCTCPGWMKKSGKDWEMEEAPTAEHYDAFAALCVEVAKRYPQVRYYQVWNEFKGLWNRAKNNWDVEAYTTLYNKVYDALKKHDSKLNVGGFYLVVQGTGSNKPGNDTHEPWSEKDRELLKYWLKNKHGADFICVDRGIQDFHDKNKYTLDELMALTPLFGKAVREIHELSDLPVWWAEYYGAGTETPETDAAQYASIYIHMVRSGTAAGLLWNPVDGEAGCGLVTPLRDANGGAALPHLAAFRAINEHFGRGTVLVKAESSLPMVEVLATKAKTLLVNKSAVKVQVDLNGTKTELAPYEVRLMDTPAK